MGCCCSGEVREVQTRLGRPVYHERQKRQYCGLHSLNNLFQGDYGGPFDRGTLSEFADKLFDDAPPGTEGRCRTCCGAGCAKLCCHPHHDPCTGNYDINVLVMAIESRGLPTFWLDNREGASTLDFSQVFGFLVNGTMRSRYLPGGRSRHWFAVREIDGDFWNLDSLLEEPEPAASDIPSIVRELDQVLRDGGHVIVVRIPR